jgi:hypothetical protein
MTLSPVWCYSTSEVWVVIEVPRPIQLQYEALVRGAGWLFSADDDAVALAHEPLAEYSDAGGRKWLGAPVMLHALQGKAPTGLTAPLRQFHTVAGTGLNSYAHAGIHPLQRRLEGFAEALARQTLQNSNGLLHLAYRLLAPLTGSLDALIAATQLWKRRRACLPDMAAAP